MVKLFYGNERELQVTGPMWGVLQEKCFPGVQNVEATGKEFTTPLDDKYTFISSVWDVQSGGNGSRYSGIQVMENDRILPEQGINLSELEWRSLVVNTPQLKQVMAGGEQVKGFKRKAPTDNILMFQWVIHVKDEGDGDGLMGNLDLPKCEEWYFSEKDARKLGRVMLLGDASLKKSKQKYEVKVVSELRPPPSPLLLVKLCTALLVQLVATLCAKASCAGCKAGVSELSTSLTKAQCQGDGGCDDPQKLVLNIEQAFEYITAKDITHLVKAFCKQTGVNWGNIDLVCDAAYQWIPHKLWHYLLFEGLKVGYVEYNPLMRALSTLMEDLEIEQEFLGKVHFDEKALERVTNKKLKPLPGDNVEEEDAYKEMTP